MNQTQSTAPGNWFETESPYDFQRVAWQNGATENILVIEERQEPWHKDDELPDLYVHLVSDDFMGDPNPIRTVLKQTKDMSEAVHSAHDFMEASDGEH